MFKSPIEITGNWFYNLDRLQIPVDNTLRYPGYSLNGIRISKTSGAVAEKLLVPVKSYIKVIQVGTDTWFELEPLLVSNPTISRRFETGFPVIYIKTAEPDAISEAVYDAGDTLGGSVHEFSFAIQFTDRIERDVAHCCTLILAAMQGNAETGSWSNFCDAIQDKADITFLRLNGSAFSDNIALIFEAGGADEPFTYIPGTTLLKNIINGRAGSLRLASPGSEANLRYLWVTTNALHQTRVSYERASIVAETRIILLADLFEWFAPQSVTGSLPRFTTGNRLTYFTNGPDFFDDIFKEISQAATDDVGAESRFFLAGYSMFDNIPLINKDGNNPATLEEAVKSIVDKAGQCYFLPLQLFELSGQGGGPLSPDEVVAVAALVALVLAETGLLVQVGGTGVTAGVGIVASLPIVATGIIMVFATSILESGWLLEKIQGLSAKVDKLEFTNANGGRSRKIFAVHPAHWDDNPHQGDDSLFLVGLSKSLMRGTTSYHQKIAAVKNSQWISYCGGVDFNIDRLDDPKHLNVEPFHDVHAKVTGAAAADIAVTFIERWNHENRKKVALGQPDDPIDVNQLDLPQPPSSPITEGDIVQVARTNFRVNPSNGQVRALPYAASGDRTILNTLLQAISRAKEYIYIEDQFLAPPKEFRDALLAAIDNGLKSLVIMLPSTPEQVYGETQRERFITELMLKNAGREVPVVRVGYPRRNYMLPKTQTEKLVGRLKTGKDMDILENEIFLGPISRVPTSPFYISVEGEIMLITGKTPGMPPIDSVVDGVVTPGMDDSYPKYQQYRVERAGATNFYDINNGCEPRTHKAGTPVTVVVFSGIYVHAKCMLVDDVFLSIGSANMNRRGLYADAEANVFSVPSQLRFTAHNPVSELRKELWAEHLNLPISMGKVLLEDPVSASRLFDRRADSGNRFIPYRAVSNTVRSFANKIGNISIDLNSIAGLDVVKATFASLLLMTEAFDFDEIYFHASDPSSFTENPIEDIDV